MPRRLTISKIEHAGKCQWPYREDVPKVPFRSNKYADIGNAFANFVATWINGGVPIDTMEEAEPYIATWRKWFGDEPYGLAETAIAISVSTGKCRALGQDINREYDKYGATPDDICGSLDHEFLDGNTLFVQDWKTGRQANLTVYKNPQVRLYAAARGLMLGVEHAGYRVVVIGRDEVEAPEWDFMDHKEMLCVVADACNLAREIELFAPEPKPGPHCTYCDHAAICPAVAKDQVPLIGSVSKIESDEHCASVINQLTQAQAKMDATWNMVNAYAREHPIDMNEAGTYGLIEYEKETIDADKAEAILGPGHVKIKRSIAKTGMDRELVERLRKAGAMIRTPVSYVGFRKKR